MLEFPVVSGNVSLYNETNGEAILPTPAIGGVGLIEDSKKAVNLALPGEGQTIILVGETLGHLGQSIYLREFQGEETGAPPPVNLAKERKNGDFVRNLIQAGHVTACHDISDGGLAAAIAEMAVAGNVGIALDETASGTVPLHAWLFGEDQARYIVASDEVENVIKAAKAANVEVTIVGFSTGDQLSIAGFTMHIEDIQGPHERWMPDFMGTM